MNAPQRTMLFSLFARLCRAMARKTRETQDLLRADITEDLFGSAISWSDFDNRHIDRMKRRLVAMLNPHDLGAQLADSDEGGEQAERDRLLNRIDADMAKAGFGDWYVKKIAVDFYDRADWRELPLEQLKNLRNTIANRARKRAAKTPDFGPARHC